MSSSVTEEFTLEDAAANGFLVLYAALLVLGSIASVLFMIAMFRGRRVFGQWPFYHIVRSLMHLDAIYLVFQITFVFPSMVAGETTTLDAWYSSKMLNAAISVFEFLPAKGVLYLTLLMTLNRLAVFVVPSMSILFTRRNIHYTIAGCWSLTWSVCVLCVLVRPTHKFNRAQLRFEDIGDTIVSAPLLVKIIDYSDNVVPFITLFISAVIYWAIRKKRCMISSATSSCEQHTRSRGADDSRMLLQAILICAFLQLYNVVNIVSVALNDRGITDYILNMLMLTLSVANHSIHAAIFMVTNSTVRAYLPNVACCKNICSSSSVTFFDYLQTYLRDITYEYAHYDEYQGAGNRSLTDLGGVLGAIIEDKVLTELSGAGAKPSYFEVFDISPPAGTDALSFYEATIGTESWSPLSYFIPFSPLIFTLAIVAIVIIGLLEVRVRRTSLLASTLTGISSAFFVFGVTFLVFAYGAGFQGNMIAATPPEQIPYDALLREFESGARHWYFHIFGLADFSSLSTITRYEEQDMPKLIGLMCARPGVVTVALYKEEYLEMQLYDAPNGCKIQKVNLVAPTQSSPTYYNFATTYYYFLLPKKLPRRLRDGINFVANSVFQPDHLEGHLLYRSVKPRSFVDITPVPAPLADYSPLSLYGLGVIIVIFVALLSLSILVFVLEVIVYRLKLVQKIKRRLPIFEKIFVFVIRY